MAPAVTYIISRALLQGGGDLGPVCVSVVRDLGFFVAVLALNW